MAKAQPIIIQYTNLLHQWRDPNAEAVKLFRERHSNDRVFLKRASVLDKLFRLKMGLPVGEHAGQS